MLRSYKYIFSAIKWTISGVTWKTLWLESLHRHCPSLHKSILAQVQHFLQCLWLNQSLEYWTHSELHPGFLITLCGSRIHKKYGMQPPGSCCEGVYYRRTKIPNRIVVDAPTMRVSVAGNCIAQTSVFTSKIVYFYYENIDCKDQNFRTNIQFRFEKRFTGLLGAGMAIVHVATGRLVATRNDLCIFFSKNIG